MNIGVGAVAMLPPSEIENVSQASALLAGSLYFAAVGGYISSTYKK